MSQDPAWPNKPKFMTFVKAINQTQAHESGSAINPNQIVLEIHLAQLTWQRGVCVCGGGACVCVWEREREDSSLILSVRYLLPHHLNTMVIVVLAHQSAAYSMDRSNNLISHKHNFIPACYIKIPSFWCTLSASLPVSPLAPIPIASIT